MGYWSHMNVGIKSYIDQAEIQKCTHFCPLREPEVHK